MNGEKSKIIFKTEPFPPSHQETNPTVNILPRPLSGNTTIIDLEDVSTVLIDHYVVSVLERLAFTDLSVPCLGILYGSVSADCRTTFIKTSLRLPRDSRSLLIDRRVIPNEHDWIVTNRRIRDEGFTTLGYYYSVCENEIFKVDHHYIVSLFEKVNCKSPILLRINRMLVGSETFEAGSRISVYRLSNSIDNSFTLFPLSIRLMDSSYVAPTNYKLLVENDFCEFEEILQKRALLESQGRNINLEYDMELNKLILRSNSRRQSILWNEERRLAIMIQSLKRRIKDRIDEVLLLWNARFNNNEGVTTGSMDGELLELQSTSQRVSILLHQLVTKELSAANADSLKKLPVINNVVFHDRPTITMKPSKIASGTTKRPKHLPPKPVVIPSKVSPRPILPATNAVLRSRTSSFESLNTGTLELKESKSQVQIDAIDEPSSYSYSSSSSSSSSISSTKTDSNASL